MKHPAYAGGRPADFAHLMGAPAGRSRAEADDDDAKDRARKARRAAEDKKRAEEDDRRKKEDAKRAEEDNIEPGEPAETDGEGEEADCPECDGTGEVDGETCPLCGGDGKVHAPDTPDNTDDDLGPEGKKAERARWTKVLGHKDATGRVGAACAMLANGDMSAAAIVATLKSLPAQGAQGRSSLRDRMAGQRIANPGADASAPKFKNQAEADAHAIVEAGRRRRGEA